MNLADLYDAKATDVAALPVSVLATLQEELGALHARTKRIGAVLDKAMESRYGGQNAPGTTHRIDEGFDVRVSIGKRVDWDKDTLYDLADQGDNGEWIDWTPSVAENRYNAAPDRIKTVLDTARTVKMSKPKFEFKRKD